MDNADTCSVPHGLRRKKNLFGNKTEYFLLHNSTWVDNNVIVTIHTQNSRTYIMQPSVGITTLSDNRKFTLHQTGNKGV